MSELNYGGHHTVYTSAKDVREAVKILKELVWVHMKGTCKGCKGCEFGIYDNGHSDDAKFYGELDDKDPGKEPEIDEFMEQYLGYKDCVVSLMGKRVLDVNKNCWVDSETCVWTSKRGYLKREERAINKLIDQ